MAKVINKHFVVESQQTKLYDVVKSSSWAVGGDKPIDTKFEYTVEYEASTTRKLPPDSTLNYASIPKIAHYGQFKLNPGGVKFYVSNKEVKFNTAGQRMVVAAINAKNAVIAKQFTDLDIVNNTTSVDSQFPVILTYLLALQYNTQFLITPILHIRALQAFIYANTSVGIYAANRINWMLRQFQRNKFRASWDAAATALKQAPLHAQTVDKMKELLAIEKINNAENTSFDYVNYAVSDNIDTAILSIKAKDVDQPFKLWDHVMEQIAKKDIFANRTYIIDTFKLITSKTWGIAEQNTFSAILDEMIQALNTIVATVTAQTTIFSPLFQASSLISEFVDMSVYKTHDIDKLFVNIRAQDVYAKLSTLSHLTPTYDSTYGTIAVKTPLYRGSLQSSSMYTGSNLLLMTTVNGIDDYLPLIDVSKVKLTSAWIYSAAPLDSYLTIGNKIESTFAPISQISFTDNSGPVLTLKKKFTFNDMVISGLMNWLAYKHDISFVRIGTGSEVPLVNYSLTGSRITVLPNIIETILAMAPAVFGLKPSVLF